MATVAELNVAVGIDDKASSGLANVDRTLTETVKKLGSSLNTLGATMSVAITAPLTLLGKGALDAGRSFESAFAGVRKTVEATEPELAKLSQEFRNLAKEIPITANEMARIGEAAGALGVKKQDILAFTRTMADLGVTTNLTSDQAATGLARLANIISNEAGPSFDRLGATLVALGNAGASTESEILDMSLRIASAGKIAGLSEPEILGFANALSSLGLEAEAGGTSFSRLLINITDATKLGGKELKLFAQVAGQSAADFKKAFETDAAGATIKFIEGLGKIAKSGQSLTPILKELELADIRVSDALRRTAGSGDLLTQSVQLGTKAWAENAALTKEANERYKTFDSQLQIFKNRLADVGITLFTELRPALDSIVNGLKSVADWLSSLDPSTRKVIVVMGLLAASVGPVLLAFGSLARAVVAISEVMTVLHVTAIPRLIAGFGGLGAAAGLAGIAVAGAFIAAEFQFQRMKSRFIEGQRQMQEASQQANRAALSEAVKTADAMKKLGGGMQPGQKITLSVGITADTKPAEEAVKAGMGKIKTSAGEGGKAAGKAFHDPFLEAVKSAMKDITQTIKDGLLGGDEIGRVLAQKIAPVVDALKTKAAALAVTIRAVGDALNDDLGRAMDSVTPKIIRGDGTFEALINRMIDMKRAAETAARATKEEFDALSDTFKDLSSQLPRAWNTIIDSILQGSGRVGTDLLKLGVKVKGFASDLINVFDTMPGKWGNALRRAMDEVNKWVSFLDSAIKLVQRFLGDEQTGIGGIFTKLGGIFKKTTDEVSSSVEKLKGAGGVFAEFGAEMESAGSSMQKSASNILGGLSSIAAGVLAFAGVKGAGAGVGAVGGALGALGIAGGIAKLMGVAFKSLFTGPAAPFVIAGIGVGAIIGALFGRKSELQKAQEAAALQQAKDAIKLSMQNVLKGAQEVIQSATESFMKALEFFDKLDEFTPVRKAKFQEFWKAMTRLMNGFFDLAKQFVNQSMPQLKAVAETIGPIANAISTLPLAFEAINGHFGIAQSSIDNFFNDFSKLMDAFFVRSEVWIDGISKRAMKVANRLSPVVALISAFGTAMTDITGIKEPGDEMFAIFDRVIDKIVTHVANLSLKFDKAVLKTMANFAEKAGAALSIWKEAIESIKATVDIQAPSEQSVDNVVAGIELFINKLGGAVERLITTDLARITAFANTIAPIAAAIKAWAETAEVVRGYTAIAAEVWDQIVADFERGLVLLNLLILDAQLYVEKATTFKTLIEQGTSLIDAALRSFGSGISAAASALSGGLPSGGTSMGASAASTLAPMSASQSASTTVVQPVVHVHVSNMIAHTQVPEFVERAIMDLYRSGRVSGSVFTGLAPAR